MAATKIRLNQINAVELKEFVTRLFKERKESNLLYDQDAYTWRTVANSSSGLVVNDVTKKIEFTPPDEDQEYVQASQQHSKTMFNDALREKLNIQEGSIGVITEPKFRVFDLDNTVIGETFTHEAAESLFLELHPYFVHEAVKNFIYDI